MPINRKESSSNAARSTANSLNKKTSSKSRESSESSSSSQVRWGKNEEFLNLRCSLRNDL